MYDKDVKDVKDVKMYDKTAARSAAVFKLFTTKLMGAGVFKHLPQRGAGSLYTGYSIYTTVVYILDWQMLVTR